MGVRKNAKLLTSAEREAFVRACVMMKADIVNPLAAAADRYSKWDELVAVHRMIQNADAPGAANVNFGHGGSGSFSFLSWHRYFLFLFEQELQSYVPGVMLPYWDWTDPSPILTPSFLGPDGGAGDVVTSGYFGATAPGTPGNPTPAPAWWPAGLNGWILPGMFPGSWPGPLRRSIASPAGLPTAAQIQHVLARSTYPSLQDGLESGAGLPTPHQMHNGLHVWLGGHMSNPTASPFDPIFYLHHCNIDRLWAMWQMDGHADEYPLSGGSDQHHRNDIMYPWTGGAAGYSSNISWPPIVMPDYSALGPQRNVDTLDHRALGYTYDTLPVIGIGLDRTGSMLALTPDPMTVAAPDVTKWEAATRGVSAFLQDCETVQASGVMYVTAGIRTFRSLAANEFTSVFPGTPYGLIKGGSAYSRAVFDSVAGGLSPGGGTPLADALQDVEDTLVEPPFGWIPADEPRYLAMLTDGMLTSGSPLASIPDGSFAGTAIFAMGFGHAADVDYATLQSVVDKGRPLATSQIFHGENAGTIDKFFSNALAAAMGFTTIFDPVLELFAGEHVHFDLDVTSADDVLLITAQGMDFIDDHWSFHLVAPDGVMDYGGIGHAHGGSGSSHAARRASVTAQRHGGRLSLVLHRDSADTSAWVGNWQLMAAYRTKDLDGMVMPDLSELVWPVSAGPVRGPRFARLLARPSARTPARSIKSKPLHRLDVRPPSTNRAGEACSLVVNVFAQSRLRMDLVARPGPRLSGTELAFDVRDQVLTGNVTRTKAFARLVAPAVDLRARLSRVKPSDVPRSARLKGSESLRFDPARVLGLLERKDSRVGKVRDEEAMVVSHDDGPLHIHIEDTDIAGTYHLGVYVAGTYCPEHAAAAAPHNHLHRGHAAERGGHADTCNAGCAHERFSRLLAVTAGLTRSPKRQPSKPRGRPRPKKPAKSTGARRRKR